MVIANRAKIGLYIVMYIVYKKVYYEKVKVSKTSLIILNYRITFLKKLKNPKFMEYIP